MFSNITFIKKVGYSSLREGEKKQVLLRKEVGWLCWLLPTCHAYGIEDNKGEAASYLVFKPRRDDLLVAKKKSSLTFFAALQAGVAFLKKFLGKVKRYVSQCFYKKLPEFPDRGNVHLFYMTLFVINALLHTPA